MLLFGFGKYLFIKPVENHLMQKRMVPFLAVFFSSFILGKHTNRIWAVQPFHKFFGLSVSNKMIRLTDEY